jgi:transglutaminase-like putative cysteine protease
MTALADYLSPAKYRRPGYWQWVTDWEEWLSFGLVSIAVLAAVSSVARADWVEGMTNLAFIAVVGLVAGFLLAHVRANGWLLQIPVVIGGFLLLAWQILAVVPGDTYADRWDLYWTRIGEWIDVAWDGGVSNDPLPFITLVSFVTLAASYLAAWSVFRWRNAWVALLPIGVVLFMNISFLPDKFDFALVIFLFAAFLLTMRMAMTRRQEKWQEEEVEYPELISLSALHDTAWVAVVLLVAAWVVPTANNIPVLDAAWDGTFSGFDGVGNRMDRLFSGIDSKTPTEIRDYDEFYQFRGDLDLDDRTLLRVNAPFDATLLRGATYDEYTPLGWLEADRESTSVELDIDADTDPEEVVDQIPALVNVEGPTLYLAGIETRAETDTIFTIGQPVGASVEADLIASSLETYELAIDEPAQDRLLPEDIRAVTESIRETANINPLALSNEDIARQLGDGLVALSISRDELGEVTRIVVVRGDGLALNTSKIEAPDNLPDNFGYASVGIGNLPSNDALNAAGDDYPQWVSDTYLQLPEEFPERVRELAEQVTAQSETNFGKAVAISNYLKTAYPTHNLEFDGAPVGADAVEHFLFQSGDEGAYFDYYASAMAVMLRSIGIPSRFVTGYHLDRANYEDGTFRVRENNQFSWVDVYFPGIGWVEFNPSPAGPLGFTSDLPGATASFFPESYDAAGLGSLLPGDESFTGLEDPLPEFEIEARGGGAEGDEAVGESSGPPTAVLLGLLAVFGVIALVVIAGGAVWQLTVRGLSYPAQIWEKTVRLASWAGVGVEPSDTPREFARKLSAELPEVKGIPEMGETYSRAQFGGKELTPEEKRNVSKVWRDVRGALTARLLRIRRG